MARHCPFKIDFKLKFIIHTYNKLNDEKKVGHDNKRLHLQERVVVAKEAKISSWQLPRCRYKILQLEQDSESQRGLISSRILGLQRKGLTPIQGSCLFKLLLCLIDFFHDNFCCG